MDTPVGWIEKAEAARHYADFSTSLGFSIGSPRGDNTGPAGSLGSVWWKSPAFKAGVTSDMELISVNGTVYAAAALRKSIVAAEKDTKPISLVFQRGNRVKNIQIDYHSGLRYPSLKRVEGTQHVSTTSSRRARVPCPRTSRRSKSGVAALQHQPQMDVRQC